MKRILHLLTWMTCACSAIGQNVTIPDANFKAYLIGDATINTNQDNEIQVSEAAAYTGAIICYNQNIASLTGIEAFTSITALNVDNNQLTSLNLSMNTALTYLYCNNNSISSLDLTNNTNLIGVFCSNNDLTQLNTSSLSGLTTLFCDSNPITSLDFSSNPALVQLNAYANNLTELDLNSNSSFGNLNCGNNPNLITVKLKNGNNTNMSSFSAGENPSLLCVEVDDITYSEANWNPLPSQASYSLDCDLFLNSEELSSVELKVYPTYVDEFLTIETSGEQLFYIHNLTGAIVKTCIVSNKSEINLSELPSGLYYIRSNDVQNQFNTVKFIKL